MCVYVYGLCEPGTGRAEENWAWAEDRAEGTWHMAHTQDTWIGRKRHFQMMVCRATDKQAAYNAQQRSC